MVQVQPRVPGVRHISNFHARPGSDLDRHWSCGSRRYGDAVCSQGAAVGGACRFIRIERVREWRLRFAYVKLDEFWWAAVDSNHLPPRYQHGALPVELAAHGLDRIKPPPNRANRNSTMARIRARKPARGGGSGAAVPPQPRADYIAGVIS